METHRFRGEWNHTRGGYRWHRLSGGDHSALDDCRATLALIQEMAGAKRQKRWYEVWA